MASENSTYSLKFWVNPKQISRDSLDTKVRQILRNNLTSIELSIQEEQKFLSVSLTGEIEVIDSCHESIKEYFSSHQINCIRVEDEVSNQARIDAYPIISDIEQRFRSFINTAILEVEEFDFDWWSQIAPSTMKQKVELIMEKSGGRSELLSPLECTFLDDLIEIINTNSSKMKPDESLSVATFLNLLENSNSIEDIANELKSQITEISYWDKFFSRYFQDKKDWEKIKKDMNFVIRERNKVMHHRPMKYGSVSALRRKKGEIFKILDAARIILSPQEIIDARQDIANIQQEASLAESRYEVIVNFSDQFIVKLGKLLIREQEKIISKIERLSNNKQILRSSNFKKIRNADGEESTYWYRVNMRDRVVFTLDGQDESGKPILTAIDIFRHNS
jgi:hypothetical protein